MIKISFLRAFWELLEALPFEVEGRACDLIRKTGGSGPGYSAHLYIDVGVEICKRAAVHPLDHVDHPDPRREMLPAHVVAWIVSSLGLQPVPGYRHMIACVEYVTGKQWLSREQINDLIQVAKAELEAQIVLTDRLRKRYLAYSKTHGEISPDAQWAKHWHFLEEGELEACRKKLLEAARMLTT